MGKLDGKVAIVTGAARGLGSDGFDFHSIDRIPAEQHIAARRDHGYVPAPCAAGFDDHAAAAGSGMRSMNTNVSAGGCSR
jgi:NAD(P)-dependent dehydrogenase (short-subunit alcohol dehydrogenase family)